MIRKITPKHIETAQKIINKEKFRRQNDNSDISNKKKNIEEMEWLGNLIKALWEDNDCLHKQPKML